jgi:two-component sensor histidine kinase
MWLVTAMPAAAPPPLTAVRLRVVRVALVLGWVSIGVVLAGSMLPEMQHVDVSHPLVWALAGVAAVANTVLAALPWPRLVDRSIGGTLLTAWAVGLIGLVTALTAADGGLASEYHLLYVLVIPFVATTEPRRRHLPLYALLLTGYSAAVLLLPGPAPLGVLVVRLGVLAAGCGLATVIARILVDNALARTQAESEARMERVLADEAHHRIKNNLQLVADLLILEAGKEGASLGVVVDETVSRIQSVAAVHQTLAARGEGRVGLRPVLERIVGALGQRLGAGRAVRVVGDDTELSGQRATWAAIAVNELVTNALRHGQGTVDVGLAARDGAVELRIADEGPGPHGATPGLGLALAQRLVTDGLGGRLSTDAGGATTLAFPTTAEV